MTPALEKAIADLYGAFAQEPKPSSIDWCDCDSCAQKQNVTILLSKPLRSLKPDELTCYAQSVFLTLGSEADFKYFLPRILEILATDEGWWPSPEVVGKSIASSDWEHFSISQQNAISEFFKEVLNDLIEKKNGWAIDSWICGIARGVPYLALYLTLFEKNPPALIAFYEQNSESLNKGGSLSNSFWDNTSPNEKLLLAWFQSDRIKDLINASYNLK